MRHRSLNAIGWIAIYTISTLASTAFAHDGHGLARIHWHATDVLGFVIPGCISALAIWTARKGK